MRSLLLWLVLATPALAADPPADAEDEPSGEPAGEGSTEEPAGEGGPDGLRIPDPADAAKLAPKADPSTRPPGVPEGWTEVPLEPEDLADDAEVIVWGTAATRAARASVVRAFEEQGWEVRRRKNNGDVVFKGPEGWMGSARLSPDGLISFRRRLLSWEPVTPVEGPPSDGFGALDPDYRGTAGNTRGGLQGPASTRKLEPHRREVLEATDDEVRHLRRVLAETQLQQQIAVIPDRLDALWNHGASLTGGPPVGTPEARRAEVLDYWATRPATREGRLVMAVVEDWLGAVVQQSEHPLTQAELEAAAARRSDGRWPLPR